MNKFFITHAWTIREAAKAQKLDTDVAFLRFKADVASGKNENTKLTDIDFGTLKEQWDALDVAEQNRATDDYSAFHAANDKLFTAIRNGDGPKAFSIIVDNA